MPTPAAPFPDRLLLASASPRRRELLTRMGLRFDVEPADVTEKEHPWEPPRDMVLHNARIKAEFISARRPDTLVLGSDTTVALDNEVLNKPRDLPDARRMLKRLGGRTHTVYTGVCLLCPSRGIDECHAVTSLVTFLPLDDDQITRYFQVVNPLDKAGAYGIQEGRELIIAKYEGSLSNIMGLPVEFLESLLDKLALLKHLRADTLPGSGNPAL